MKFELRDKLSNPPMQELKKERIRAFVVKHVIPKRILSNALPPGEGVARTYTNEARVAPVFTCNYILPLRRKDNLKM